jgi:hypothetical protein
VLESHRERHFFTAEPQSVLEHLGGFSDQHGGQTGEGTSNLGFFRFSDPTGGKRFLTASVRVNEDDSDVTGNVTLRWRDEPEGDFDTLAEKLRDRLEDSFELLSLPEARRRKKE